MLEFCGNQNNDLISYLYILVAIFRPVTIVENPCSLFTNLSSSLKHVRCIENDDRVNKLSRSERFNSGNKGNAVAWYLYYYYYSLLVLVLKLLLMWTIKHRGGGKQSNIKVFLAHRNSIYLSVTFIKAFTPAGI
jgi:hypothetical protein